MDLDTLIDRLEGLLDHSVRIPYSSRVVVNEDEYLRLVDQIRINVPEEIRRARQIEADRDEVLRQAADQAEAMIAQGRETAAQLVSDHAVVVQAQELARQVVEAAEKDALTKRNDADAYALEVLEKLAAQLQDFERVIDNGIEWLRRSAESDDIGALTGDGIEPSIVGQPSDGDPC